jgi:hypothetical protein
MPGDAFKKVQPGQRLEITAETFNAFLDADNGSMRDVTSLFDTPQLCEHGTVFWPDYACWTLKPEVWHIFGMDWMVP